MLSSLAALPSTQIDAPVDWDDRDAERHLPREVRATMTGPEGAPVIVALGGISADADVVPGHGRSGWWDLFTPDRKLAGYCIVGIDFAADDSGRYAPSPAIQSRIIDAALRAFNVDAPFAIIGASYGGMVALAWAERAERPGILLSIICADDRPHGAATAVRSLQRRIVDLGMSHNCSGDALAIARGLAMMGYRSPEEFRQRFVEQAVIPLIDEVDRCTGLASPGVEQPPGPAIAIVRRNDPCLGRQDQQREQGRRLSGAGDRTAGRALQLAQRIEQKRPVGIDRSRIVERRLFVR